VVKSGSASAIREDTTAVELEEKAISFNGNRDRLLSDCSFELRTAFWGYISIAGVRENSF